jgi:hypothetical protein
VLAFGTTFAAEQSTQDSEPGNDNTPHEVRFIHEPVTAPDLQKFQELLRADKGLEEFVESVKEMQAALIHPFSLSVKVKECGEEGAAFYAPKTQEIHLCLESVAHSAGVFSSRVKSRNSLRQKILWRTYFFFFHELGHALIDVLQLPIVGREEDAADEFATLALLAEEKAGAEAALAVAEYFRLEGTQATKNGEVAWWD